MEDKVETNNLQGLIDEGNPTLHEMAQNINPTMQMLVGIFQTQIRLLQGITQSGGFSQNTRGGGESSIVGDRTIVTLEQFQKLGPPIFRGSTTYPLAA